jgi:hypothetical protein
VPGRMQTAVFESSATQKPRRKPLSFT